jgi:hypothetical protein
MTVRELYFVIDLRCMSSTFSTSSRCQGLVKAWSSETESAGEIWGKRRLSWYEAEEDRWLGKDIEVTP